MWCYPRIFFSQQFLIYLVIMSTHYWHYLLISPRDINFMNANSDPVFSFRPFVKVHCPKKGKPFSLHRGSPIIPCLLSACFNDAMHGRYASFYVNKGIRVNSYHQEPRRQKAWDCGVSPGVYYKHSEVKRVGILSIQNIDNKFSIGLSVIMLSGV